MVSGQYSDVLARGRSIQENMKAHQHHSLLYGPHKMGEVLPKWSDLFPCSPSADSDGMAILKLFMFFFLLLEFVGLAKSRSTDVSWLISS
jgi:hypothetical protein